MNQVIDYYDRIARQYDDDRFGNSYGQYIDTQERQLLRRWKVGDKGEKTLEIACGTGRLLDFATAGVDASGEMLEIARAKHPAMRLEHALGNATPFADGEFSTVYSFHLMMHLDIGEIRGILAEAHRLLHPGGRLIFDIPSSLRRRIARRQPSGWHGDTSMSLASVAALAVDNGFTLARSGGIMMLPVHRLPSFMRRFMRGIDSFLTRSPLKEYSSYLVVELTRQ